MLFMFEIPCQNLIKNSFRKRLYDCLYRICLSVSVMACSVTRFNELSHCKCTDILLLNYFLGTGRGQMRILKAGTLTTALGNFVTFAVSFLDVPIHQTWG